MLLSGISRFYEELNKAALVKTMCRDDVQKLSTDDADNIYFKPNHQNKRLLSVWISLPKTDFQDPSTYLDI